MPCHSLPNLIFLPSHSLLSSPPLPHSTQHSHTTRTPLHSLHSHPPRLLSSLSHSPLTTPRPPFQPFPPKPYPTTTQNPQGGLCDKRVPHELYDTTVHHGKPRYTYIYLSIQHGHALALFTCSTVYCPTPPLHGVSELWKPKDAVPPMDPVPVNTITITIRPPPSFSPHLRPARFLSIGHDPIPLMSRGEDSDFHVRLAPSAFFSTFWHGMTGGSVFCFQSPRERSQYHAPRAVYHI
ncbi:hypothetical protein B0O80DRAFT_237819 [Mortierella sp. GBAus27b]|nr:hypothetical protein B0O80DRAFT_237819 [Mortierella sp. GBAus27b]